MKKRLRIKFHCHKGRAAGRTKAGEGDDRGTERSVEIRKVSKDGQPGKGKGKKGVAPLKKPLSSQHEHGLWFFSLTKSSGVGSQPVHQPALPSPPRARTRSVPNHTTNLRILTGAAIARHPPTYLSCACASLARSQGQHRPQLLT